MSRILLSRIHQGGCQSPDTEERRVTRSGTRPTSTNTMHLHLTSSGEREGEGEKPFLLLIKRKKMIHYRGLTPYKKGKIFQLYVFSIYLTFFSAIEVLEEAKRTPESMGWNNNLIH